MSLYLNSIFNVEVERQDSTRERKTFFTSFLKIFSGLPGRLSVFFLRVFSKIWLVANFFVDGKVMNNNYFTLLNNMENSS